jgi:hypothetical protein
MPCCDFFETNEAKLSSPINMAPRPLSKPPVSFSLGDESLTYLSENRISGLENFDRRWKPTFSTASTRTGHSGTDYSITLSARCWSGATARPVFDGLTFNFFLGNLKIRHKISNVAPSGRNWCNGQATNGKQKWTRWNSIRAFESARIRNGRGYGWPRPRGRFGGGRVLAITTTPMLSTLPRPPVTQRQKPPLLS